ncbi:MAG TPA: glycosyltransferase family 39 protein [Gaiellaceae bacterium]|nr:glycosyltransferase family 39 protein [Gaiellaceae bacterium]
MAGSPRASRALAAVCLAAVALGAWNVLRYPPGQGYDAVDHMAYADGLVPGGHLPHGTGEYYTPPGYYALAGSLDWLARQLGASAYGAHRAGMAVNVLFLLGTVVLAWLIARELLPGRDAVALAAAAFVAFVPVTVKAEAMFHPETMSLFLCALALWLCVRTFADRRYAVALGLALGAAQLVRAFSLWTLAAAALALAAGRRFRELAVAVGLAAAVAAPWYVHQRLEYGGSPVFDRPTVSKPLWERRPARFYVDPGLPDVVARPYAPNFRNLALPTTYAELWGDYFGIWAWKGGPSPPAGARPWLVVQSVAGILPTLAALAGWVAFLLASLRSPPRLAVALLPPLGLLGYLYFTVSYPTPDGDVLKATYMLTTTVAWGLALGYGLDRLRGRARPVAAAALAGCAVAQLPFLLY